MSLFGQTEVEQSVLHILETGDGLNGDMWFSYETLCSLLCFYRDYQVSSAIASLLHKGKILHKYHEYFASINRTQKVARCDPVDNTVYYGHAITHDFLDYSEFDEAKDYSIKPYVFETIPKPKIQKKRKKTTKKKVSKKQSSPCDDPAKPKLRKYWENE